MSDNPSHQPNWDCRQLLRKLYSLTARFEQACSPISSDNLYVYSSTPASLPFLSRGLLILSKCGHNVFVPHFLHCLDCFSPTGIQTWKNQESNPSLKSGSVKLKAPDVNAVFAGQMHPTEALLESSKPIFKRLRRWSHRQNNAALCTDLCGGLTKLFLSAVPPAEHRDRHHRCRWWRYSPAVCCQGKSINQPTQSRLKNVNSAPLTRMPQCVLCVFWPGVHVNSHCAKERTFSRSVSVFTSLCLFWNHFFKNKQLVRDCGSVKFSFVNMKVEFQPYFCNVEHMLLQ